MFEALTSYLDVLVENIGPPGIFLAMFLETIFPPIPSELIMPIGGYIAHSGNQGYLGLFMMIVAGSLGSTLGAVVIYVASMKGGRHLILKYGKRIGIHEKELNTAESWFKKYGDWAVFLGRMAPGVREIVSIPAGLSKMNMFRFLVFTFIGSFIWSAFLGSIGYFLADTWKDLGLQSLVGIVGVVIVLSIAGYFIFTYLDKVRNGKRKK